VEKLLDDVELLKAEKFVDDPLKDLSIYGLADPLRQVSFYDKDKKLLAQLLFGKDQEGMVYAMSGSQSGSLSLHPVVLVKKAIVDLIQSKAEFTKKS